MHRKMTLLQIHALNQEIAQAPDMELETRHGIRAQIKDGKLYCYYTTPFAHKRPKIGAGLFRYRYMVKDMGLDQNELTDEIMEEIRWKSIKYTTEIRTS